MTNNLLPFIELTDYQGKPITDEVTKFTYKFSEEEDDVCEFCIETPDTLIADRPNLQEGKQLNVQWGYRGSNVSRVRVIYIFDTKTTYGQDGVSFSVTCHERFALAKMDAVANKNLRQLKKNSPIIFSPEVLNNISLEIEKGNPTLKALLKDQDNPIGEGIIGEKVYEDTVVTYYNGNLSTFQSLRMFLDRLPGGPYIIDSRDNSVMIRTRNFDQASSMTYGYNSDGNELLEFSPETKNRTKGSQATTMKVTSWDKENKKAITHKLDSSADKGTVLAKNASMENWADIYAAPALTHQFNGVKVPVKQSELSKLGIKKGQKAVNTDKGNAEDYQGKLIAAKGKITIGDQTAVKLYLSTDYGSRPKDGIYQAVDNVAVAKPKFEVLNDSPMPTKSTISNETPGRAKAQAENRRKDEEMKNNPATAKMEGNPYIESGTIITIKGVALKHSGNYYIKECTHTIDDGGFITSIEKMGRQGVNRNKTKVTTTVQTGQDKKVNTTKGPDKIAPVKKKTLQSKKPDFPWER